jgi:hypothetical protein
MPSLLDSEDREAILRRLRRLQATAPARWGKLTAPRMVCHLADSLRVGLGEIAPERMDTLPSRTIAKWIVVYSPMPVPRGRIQTAPEMLATAPSTWADDVRQVELLVERLAGSRSAGTHPFFGPLSPAGWGRLAWKHVDHHLRQFGF